MATAFSYVLVAAVVSTGAVVFWPLASRAAECADWYTSCDAPGTLGVLAAMAAAVIAVVGPAAVVWPLVARRRFQLDNQLSARKVCRTLAVATTAPAVALVTLRVLGELGVVGDSSDDAWIDRLLVYVVVLVWLPTIVGVQRAIVFSVLSTGVAVAGLVWTAHLVILAPLGLAYAGLSVIAATSALFGSARP